MFVVEIYFKKSVTPKQMQICFLSQMEYTLILKNRVKIVHVYIG